MTVTLVGMGMANRDSLTAEAVAALRRADAIIGAERLLRAVPADAAAEKIACAHPDRIADMIAHGGWEHVCVALSGDVGLYSGARRLTELLAGRDIVRICGLSAPQVLAARLGRAWQDWRLVSAHGRNVDVVAEALNHPTVLFLTDDKTTPAALAADLVAADLGDAVVTVGGNLGTAAEVICQGTAAEVAADDFPALSVVLVENAAAFRRPPGPPGIPDSDFIRGGVPMTKREVRTVAISLLRLEPDSVVHDIGAGTGSVAVEAALQARRGRVYAVERDGEAVDLLRRNRQAFGVMNMSIVPGTAPAALAGLPTPDAAFIGGSGGALADIVAALVAGNPALRIVIAAVTVETLAAATEALERYRLRDIEVVQLAVSRTLARAGRHMFTAQNPIFLISGGGRA